MGKRHARHAWDVIENDVPQIAAHSLENGGVPLAHGIVRRRTEIEGRCEQDRTGATAQSLARAGGGLFRRAGDDAFHQSVCRKAEADQFIGDAVALKGAHGRAFARRAENRGGPAAARKAILGMAGQRVTSTLPSTKGVTRAGLMPKLRDKEASGKQLELAPSNWRVDTNMLHGA